MIAKLIRRLRYLANRRQMQRDLADEMAAHRDMMPEERRAAFGSDLRLREEAREIWIWAWLDQVRQDLAYAARMFLRSPGFTLGAVTVLALGVGVNLAEFQIFDAAFFHRISVAGAGSMFRVSRISQQKQSSGVPYPAVRIYRSSCTLCSFVVSENSGQDLTVETEGNVRVNYVSGNYFSALRIAPAWGRLLTESDDTIAAPPVAVLGYQYWKNSWGSNPAVVGRTVHVNGHLFRVVGVTPYDFDGLGPHRTGLWIPAVRKALITPGAPTPESFTFPDNFMYGKPRPGVPRAAVEAQLASVSHALAERAPHYFSTGERVVCDPLAGTGMDLKRMPPAVLLIVTLVLLVLLSACANLGNMLVARGLSRQREMNTRVFLGAGRARLVRQMMTENLMLALLGGVFGILVGTLASKWLMGVIDAPPDILVRTNWSVICAGIGLALVSVLAFGLPPALRLARGDHKTGRRRQVLVAVQVAISCLLLISSAIIVHGAIRSATIALAFDYQHMIVVAPQLYSEGVTPIVARRKLDEVRERLRGLPGVDSITEAVTPPLGHRNAMQSLPGLPPVWWNPVAPSYFDALKIPILRGRTFLPGEDDAVIVSESAARAVWPNEDPVGKTWNVQGAVRTVVGVVKDSGASLLVDVDSVEAYIPDTGAWTERAAVILHTKGDPAPLMRTIVLATAASGESVWAELMRSSREQALDSSRKLLTMIGSLSLVATVLAAAGMFAMVAFAVAQRTREIGIRMAIGAGPAAVLGTLLGENVRPVFFGVVAGTVAGIGLGKITRGLVYLQANMLDPAGFATGIVAFILIAGLATLSPALKALRIDPASTLRAD